MSLALPEVPRGPRSLFGELLDWMLAPLLVIWPVSVFLTWAVAQDIAARPFDHELGESARALADQVVRHPETVPGPALSLLRGEEGDLVYFQVLGPRGELLAGERRLPVAERGTASAGEVRLRNDLLGGEPLRVATLWVRPQASAADNEGLLIQVAETLGKRQRMASDIIRGVLLPQFVLLPLAALLAWLALVQGFKPLDALQQRIRSRAAEDLSPIDEGSAPEEVAPLVRAINDLLARREEALQSQKQFLADAAHQLKTPLAGLRTQAELAARAVQSGQATAEEMTRSLEQIALSSQRAANMVNQLLAMARAEGGEALATEPVDLASLARDTVQDFVPRALAKRIDLGYDGPERCELSFPGQPWLLVELIRNLVDNALNYTPTGGMVTVRVSEDRFGRVVLLQVEDNGPGIAPGARERVFQPFYRQLGTGVDGSGLGLTIAGQIAQRHGTRIELEDAHERRGSEPPGARFTIRFNAA